MTLFNKTEKDREVLASTASDSSSANDLKNLPGKAENDYKDQAYFSSAQVDDDQIDEPIEEKKTTYKFYGGNDHIFKDPEVAQHYREIYEKATYEGRNHFDPDFTWTRKSKSLQIITNI